MEKVENREVSLRFDTGLQIKFEILTTLWFTGSLLRATGCSDVGMVGMANVIAGVSPQRWMNRPILGPMGSVSTTAPRFGATTPPLPDIRAAWGDPLVRRGIETVLLGDLFRHAPRTGAAFVQRITDLCAEPLSNEQIYDQLRQAFVACAPEPVIAQSFSAHTVERTARRVRQLQDIWQGVSPERLPASLLDIGCGDGLITSRLAAGWNLSTGNVIGADIVLPDQRAEGVTYLPTDGLHLPVPPGSVDCALLLSVLHHVEDFDTLLGETVKALKPGGRLIVRDFDARTPSIRLLNSVMDLFYYRVFSHQPEVPNPGNFFAESRWLEIFRRHGLQVEQVLHPEPPELNPYHPFFAVLRKPL